MVKKLFLLFPILIVLSLFLFKAAGVNAQASQNSINPHALPLNTTSDVPQNLHTYTQASFIEILATAMCAISGTDPISENGKCLGLDLTTKKITYTQNSGGLAGALGGMIAGTYNIPVSSVQYGQYLASNFGITRTSYAAQTSSFGKGIGFIGLTPVLEIWRTFRNLTYLVFVLVFIVLGLGIMFRLNIDARTVMTIQNQIPKVIIGLVLITLSYAIAGFLIDMMYVVIYLAIHIFESQHLVTITNIGTNPISAIGSFGGISAIATPAARGVSDMIGSLFQGSIGGWIQRIVGAVIGGILGNSIGGGIGIPLVGSIITLVGAVGGMIFGSKIVGFLTLAIAYLIISIAILQSLFKVWWMLIKAYVFIFLDVLFAPFWILGGILPGAGGGVGPWLRSLISNLAAFPAVIILFMIGKSIQEQASSLGGNFVPPLVGNPGADSGSAIGSIIGLGIILVMPEAVNITKAALKAPEMKYTAAIGQALGAGSSFIQKPIGGLKHELFGKDVMGAPKPGSAWLTRKFGGSKIGRFISGGGIETDEEKRKAMPLFPINKNSINRFKNNSKKMLNSTARTISPSFKNRQDEQRRAADAAAAAESARKKTEQEQKEAQEAARIEFEKEKELRKLRDSEGTTS